MNNSSSFKFKDEENIVFDPPERSGSTDIVNFIESNKLLEKGITNQNVDVNVPKSYNAIRDVTSKGESETYMEQNKLRPTNLQLGLEEERLTKIAASYLCDYEYGRKSTLFPDSDRISPLQLKSYELRSSIAWKFIFAFGTASLFLASHFEGDMLNLYQTENPTALALFTIFSIVTYILDLAMVQIYLPPTKHANNLDGNGNENRNSFPINDLSNHHDRKEHFTVPLLLFFALLIFETWRNIMHREEKENIAMTFSGILKPIVFFYCSVRARDAFKALTAVLPMLSQIIFLELFLIFIFSVMACELYGNRFPSSFGDLPTAYINMFKLSTTVTNPSAWIEIYSEQKSSAIFFVSFLVLNVFYMHSLVLSVVFQSYVHKMTSIRRKRTNYQEDALRNAYQALNKLNSFFNSNDVDTFDRNSIPTQSLYKTLKKLREHYTSEKIEVLVGLVDKERRGFLNYHTFRTRLPNALKISLTSRRAPNSFFSAMDAFAIAIALINLIYVIYFSYTKVFSIPNDSAIRWGFFVTILSTSDLCIRLDPLALLPSIKFDNAFDSLACFASFLSIIGLFLQKSHPEFILVGRSLDLFRCLRFFVMFRDIIKRSGKVLPAFIGPLILTASAVHIFCRIGMHLWGGKIHVGTIEEISPFYDYNNFNSYVGGLITMFQVLVVNDWNQIAKVFVSLGHPWLVYTFFMSGNIVGVSILLNIFLSFFIGAFITPTPDSDEKKGIYSVLGSMTTGVHLDQLMSMSVRNNKQFNNYDLLTPEDMGNNVTDLVGDMHLSERQDFDNIMRAAIGEEDDEAKTVENLSHILELFEKLTPSSEKVGFLVCNFVHRYGNRRFQQMINKYMSDEAMHEMIEVMSNEINTIIDEHHQGEKIIQRIFEDDRGGVLEIKCSTFDEDNSIVLYVARESKTLK